MLSVFSFQLMLYVSDGRNVFKPIPLLKLSDIPVVGSNAMVLECLGVYSC